MKNRKRFIWGIVIATIILLLSTSLWLFFSQSSPINRASALKTTREWARLAPYPKSAHRFDIEIKGSMFTREFTVLFEGSPEDIKNWIKASPGTKDTTPINNADGSVCYKIEPGGGAQFAELTLDSNGKVVRIHTYWS